MAVASRWTDRAASGRPVLVTVLLVFAAALLGLALFFAGAAWRGRMTAPVVDVR